MKQFRKEQVGRGREHCEGGKTSRAGVKQIFFTNFGGNYLCQSQ